MQSVFAILFVRVWLKKICRIIDLYKNCTVMSWLLQPIHIACVGEGPVVHIMPLELEWGTVPVLQDKPKKILLSNESLIPAKFTAHMVRECIFCIYIHEPCHEKTCLCHM